MNNDNNKIYHNTTRLEGEELDTATDKARKLKAMIKHVFIKSPEPKTPFEVSKILLEDGLDYPITSIRARINALTSEGILLMSATACRIGDYGAKNHTWSLLSSQPS